MYQGSFVIKEPQNIIRGAAMKENVTLSQDATCMLIQKLWYITTRALYKIMYMYIKLHVEYTVRTCR